MNNYSELCIEDQDLLGTGAGNCAKSLGPDKRYFLADSTFTGTAAQLKLQTFWEAAIVAGTVHPFPEVMEIESQNTEAGFFETASGKSFKVKNEIRKTMYKFVENIVTHSGLKSYSDQGWNIWFYTKNGYLRCHTKSTDLFEGLPVDSFYVNAQETATFDTVEQSPSVLEFNDVDDWDMEFGVIQPDFNMMDLEGVFQSDVVVTSATNPAALLTVIVVVTVKGSNDPLSGLLPADFEVLDELGVSLTVDTAVESPTGTYTVVATDDATTGTIGLNGIVTIGTTPYQSKAVTYLVP